jgi:tRNA pseudouridine55 synthase
MNNPQSAPPSGLIILDKKPHVTSFDSLAEIKKSISSGKAGHTGTLDKFAQGLLLVLTGKALKLSPWFSGCDKRYEATVTFGAETDTLDPEGTVIARADIPVRGDIEKVFPQFTGAILQAPPEYSAIHIDGKRASAIARSGQIPEMKPRPVFIYRLEMREWNPPHAHIFVHCSGGTYIRSLARDIALAAGSRAYVSGLTRTQVAGFTLEHKKINEDAELPHNTPPAIHPIDKSVFCALGIPRYEISSAEAPAVMQGKPLGPLLAGKQPVTNGLYALPPDNRSKEAAAVFCDDSLVAVIEKEHSNWKYGYVYAHS